MLTNDQVAALRVAFEKIADPVNEYLIRDIARRVSEAGQLTSTAAYQIWRAQNLRKSRKEIEKAVAAILKKSTAEVRELFKQAAEVGYRFDLNQLPTAEAIPFEDNTSVQRIVEAAVQLADENFQNITQTLGFQTPGGTVHPLLDAYQKTTDFAFQQVITGATDYNTAIRRACQKLADGGIKSIDYASGVHTTLEAAIRRNMMGGLGLMVEQISQKNHDDLGADGWELSAHANSAPDHEPFQGKQYTDEAYTKLNDSLQRRIGTLNCGHNAFPIILGVNEPQYTKEQLEKFREDNEKGVTIDGKHYTGYEATQMQRKLERAIRKQKNRVLVDEATGDKEKLLTDQIKLQRYRQEYSRFSKTAGLRTENERAQVAGFGRGEAARATTAAKKQIAIVDSFTKTMSDVGYKVKGFDYYVGDAETLNQMQTAFTRMAKEFPDEAKDLTVRLDRAANPNDYGWFSPETRTVSFNRDLFKYWDILQQKYAEAVKAGDFPLGTDARGCFYHEFGHVVGYARGINDKKCTLDAMVSMGLGFGNPPHMTAKAATERLPSLLSGYSAEFSRRAFDEVIAECFSEWYNSEKPRAFCQEFLRKAGVL